MLLITRWTQAATAADRLKAYGPHFGSFIWKAGQKKIIEDALTALGPNPHPDAVEALWPNAAGQIACDECGVYSDEVVQIGQEPAYESNTACVCAKCLMKAMVLIEP